MANVLITGANRGLGFGLTQHYLAKGDHVWACYRNDMGKLEQGSSVHCYPLKWDVTQPLSHCEQSKLPEEINLLINNAGVYGSKQDGQQLHHASQSEMMEVFSINTMAPLSVVQGLLPRLIDIETSVAGLSAVIDNIDTYPPGAFVAFDGAIIPY
jgi:NAD(P)-dependent dehydrogenase (short-subunit alcohol dehydrogenase family)